MNKSACYAKPDSRQRGFTLVEVLIVLAIIGILATLAAPSYRNYIQNTARTDVQGELMAFAAAMEQYRGQTFSYAGATAAGVYRTSAGDAGLRYDLSVLDATAATYVIAATPRNGDSHDGTGRLSVNQIGVRCWYENNDTIDPAADPVAAASICTSW